MINGFKILISSSDGSFDAVTFYYEKELLEATKRLRQELGKMKTLFPEGNWKPKLEPAKLDKCKCGRFFEVEYGSECLRCEEMRSNP